MRSNLAVEVSTSSWLRVRPASPELGGMAARSGSTNMTWKSGVWLRSALRLQLLDQALEGQVLVGVGAAGPWRAPARSSSRKRGVRRSGRCAARGC